MYKNILLPIDLNGPGDFEAAHKAAVTLAGDDGKITLLHVVEPIPTYVETYMVADFKETTLKGAKERLGKVSTDLDVPNMAVLYGSPGRSIVDWAEENNADCIVIASHQPALSDWVLGSTAAWVVRHTPTAIHVVR